MAYSSKYTEELLKTKKKKKTYTEQVLSGEYTPLSQEVKVKTDIVPVKTTEKEDSIFSAFDDGYDFGDVSRSILKGGVKLGKTVFNTGKEVVTHPIQSAKAFGVGTVEGIDKANTLINNAVDDFFVWASPFRDKEDEEGTLSLTEFNKLSSETDEATKKKLLETYEDKYGKDSALYQTLKLQLETKPAKKNLLNMKYTDTETYKKAVEGKLSDGQENIYGIGENVGQMLPSMAVGGVAGGLAGSGVFFTQVQQGYTEDALARGYEDKDARIYGLVMGGAELLAEQVTKRLGLGVDETAGFQQLSLKNIKKTMAGEGLEEFAMPYVDDLVTYIGFEDGYSLEKFGESTEEALEGAVMGATVGVIMSAGGRGLQKVDTVIQKVNTGQEITQNDLVEAGKEIQENAPELLEEAMREVPLVVQEQLAKDVTSEDVAVQEDIAPVQQTEQDNIPIVEANQEQTVQQAGQQDTQQVDETELKRQYYVSEAKETDSQYRKDLNEDASKFANNTKRTHEFVNTLSNVSEATGISIRLTNNTSEEMIARRNQLIKDYAKNKKVSLEVAEARFKDIILDGYKTKDGVVINVNSPKALNRLVGHEITHILEKTGGYSKLQKIAIDYAKTKNEYQDRKDIIEAMYDGVPGEVSRELTSDIVGDYLFTDQAFIERIQQTDRNLFQRIYDEVKHLIKMATAGSKEARQLEQLKHTFEKVMRENKEISNKASKVTVQESESNLATEVESNTQEKEETVQKVEEEYSISKDNKDRTLSEGQLGKFANSKIVDENGNLLVMYHGTGANFNVFDINKSGENYEGWSAYGRGFYFTPNEDKASDYASETPGEDFFVKEVYLNVEKPFYANKNYPELFEQYNLDSPVNQTGREFIRLINSRDGREASTNILRTSGYDGIIEDFGEKIDEVVVFESNQIKNVDNTNPTESDDIRYSLSEKTDAEVREALLDTRNDISEQALKKMRGYIAEQRPNFFSDKTDNLGRKLSKGMKSFMKNSKARDVNESLSTVYHTMTHEGVQFNEFNPVGTMYYRFGDQVVNYYTDSKIMSGSYADQRYTKATTKRITTMKEVNDYVNSTNLLNSDRGINYKLVKNGESYELIDDRIMPNTDKTKGQVYKEAVAYKKSLTEDELAQFKDMFQYNPFSGTNFNIDSYLMEKGYKFGSEQDRIASKYAREVNNLNYETRNIYLDVLIKDKTNDISHTFKDKIDLYKNIRKVVNEKVGLKGKYQYEGYVNLTNPYVADAEGRGWQHVEGKEDSKTTKKMMDIDTLTKDRLTQLAQDSKNTYERVYAEQRKWQDAVNSIDGSLREENTLEMRSMNHVFRSALANGIDAFINKKYQSPLDSKDESLNKLYEWRTNNDIMTALVDWDLITHKEYDTFHSTLEVPDSIRDKVRELANTKVNYNEYDADGRNPVKKQETIYNLWNNYLKASQEKSNIGDSEYSIFNAELLDGYLKEELKDSFPVRDEFGINHSTLKDLYKVASHNFDRNYIRNEFNDWSTTNDVVKRVIEMNKNGSNYDGVIMKNVVDYGGSANGDYSPANLYVTFNSNQFKAWDNPNPTEDNDMSYSLSRADQDIAPVKEADVFGSDIALQEAIAPLQEQVQELTKAITDLQENIAPATQDLAEAESDRTLREITEEDIDDTEGTFAFDEEIQVKKKLEIIKDLQRDFNIKHTEARELYNKLASIPEVTVEDIYTELENYRKVKFQEQDDYHKSIQDYIKGTKLDVSEIKKQITDYSNTYRMANMGKGLTLANSGQSIDSFYQELNELYPNEFPDTVTAEADQLELISQAMFKDTAFEYTETLDNDELQILAERIYSDIGNTERYKHGMSGLYFLNKEVKKMTPPGELNTDVSVDEYESTLSELLTKEEYEKNASITEQTEESVSIADELNKLDLEQPSNLPRIESENPFDEMLDKFLQRGKKTPVRKVTKEKSLKDSLKGTFGTLQELTFNDMYQVDKLADDYKKPSIKHNGYMLKGVAGEVQGDIFTGQTDNYGNVIGDSIVDLWKPAHEQGLYEQFEDRMKHKLNAERWKTNKPLWFDISAKQSNEMVKAYDETYPQFKEWAEKIYKYYGNSLENKIEANLVNEQQQKLLREELYPSYVRIEVDKIAKPYVDMSPGEVRSKAPLKRAIGGSGDNAISLEQSMINGAYADKIGIRQNKLYLDIAKALEGKRAEVGADVRQELADMSEALYLDADTGKYYLTAYDKGEQFTVEINKELYDGLNNNLKHTLKDIETRLGKPIEIIQKLGNLKRDLVTTYSPTFWFTNPPKDLFDGLINSKHILGFMKNYPIAWKEAITNTGDAPRFRTLYGSAMNMGDYAVDSGAVETEGKLTTKLKNTRLLRGINKMNEITEIVTRLAEFKASQEAGNSLEESMYNAREVTVNFDRGGTLTKFLDRNGFKFLNVSAQGFDKFIRNFSGQEGARATVGAWSKAIAFGVAPALLNHLLFGGEDEDEDYEALPDYIKDNYFLFKTDDGEFIRIPKGRMMAVFGSASRRIEEYLSGEEDAFEGFLQNSESQIGMANPFDNFLLAPIIQAYGSENGEAWYGGDLVPSRLQDKAPEEQYDSSTDKMSIWLGEQFGISPYKLNYVIDQYSGGIGDFILPMMTEEATSEGGVLAPITDKFTTNSTSDNKYAGEIYSLTDELDKMPTATKETDEYKIQDSYLYSITSEMGKLYAERREVQSDDSLSKSEKYQKVQAIQDQINSLAKEGLDNYQNISKTDNYAIVGGREFNKYTSQEGEERWGSVREEVLSDLNSMGLDLEEKSSYFKATSTVSKIQDRYKDSDDYTGKKREIISTIKETNLTDEAKAYLYDKYYASSDTLNVVTTIGMDFDSYLDFESQQFEADKNIYGKTISGSKKTKVFDYINSMNLSFEEKVILAKLQYNTYDEYNYEIIDYLNNRQDITYEEEVDILKKLGFTVDEYGNIYWD